MKERSKVSKKTCNAILIIELFIISGILFIAIQDISSNNFGTNTVISIIVLLFAGAIIPCIIKPLLIMSFESIEDFDKSKEYVQQHLSKEYCIEVIPVKDEPEHEKFLTKELPKRAKFYAKINDDDSVSISIIFNGENDSIDYGEVASEYFTRYFKVINL